MIGADARLGWSMEEVAAAIEGTLVGATSTDIDRVAIDSREDLRGAMFVAIRGERFDGHDFVDDAVAAGAVGVIVERRSGATARPRVEVEDAAEALKAMAALRRSELEIPVVAITGSTGKTSTKDLLAAGLEGSWASPRSFNNEVGVPLTVLATPPDATALVLEVGSRGAGHIRWLTDVVRPDVSVVTNLGVVHLETFGSEEGLADAKYEIIEMLTDRGTAVIPATESRLDRGRRGPTLTFGSEGSDADVIVDRITVDGSGRPSFVLRVDGRRHSVTLDMAGRHQAMNAAAAVAVARAFGTDLDDFISRMEAAKGSDWRMDVHEGAITVVNDAYNANPQSVEGALRSVAEMGDRRRIAVLGPMAELGSVCEREHARIGAVATTLDFDILLVVGPDHGYVLGAPSIVVNATDLEGAADTLHAIVEPGDVVLVKASRAAGLEHLALSLIESVTP